MLAHEMLEVYWLVEEYVSFIDYLLPRIQAASRRDGDQLDRSGGSMILNLIEGAADHAPGDKARFFRYSRREVNESFGGLWRHRRKNTITEAELCIGRYYVNRASATLWGLIKSWENGRGDG